MKLTTLLQFLILSFISDNIKAQNPNEGQELKKRKSLKKLLIRDLKYNTKKLSRAVPLYSWTQKKKLVKNFSLPSSQSIIYSHKAFLQFAMSKFDLFFDYKSIDAKAAVLGNGLYAYHNPVGSSSYGNTLIEVIIPKGSSYLDLRYNNIYDNILNRQLKISKKTKDALNSTFSCKKIKGTAIDKFEGIEFYAVDKNKFMKCPDRSKILKEVFAELNIAFISYEWRHGKASKYCPDSNGNATGFVINSGPWTNKAKITGYIKKFVDEHGSEHLNAYRSIHFFSKSIQKSKAQWRYFKRKKISTQGLKKIMNKFGCGQYAEDKM